MKVPANVVKDLETWNTIFKRYGRPPLVDLGVAKSPQSASRSGATTPDAAEYEFDPL
jgi:hypothetical protein